MVRRLLPLAASVAAFVALVGCRVDTGIGGYKLLCSDAALCPAGLTCVGGRCDVGPAPQDGGAAQDGGVVDGGVADGGVADGGGVAIEPASFAAGRGFTCTVRGPQLSCWGSNVSGELGIGHTTASATPFAVNAGTVMNIAAGGGFACAITDARSLYCWGGNDSGRLGMPGGARSVPTLVPLTDVTHVSAGQDHACAVSRGLVHCWGLNLNGQLGPGAGSSSTTPIAVAGLGPARRVVAGGQHTCALLTDGAVRCWGANVEGQLGDGTNDPSSTPVAVMSLGNVSQLTAGRQHTCALAEPRTGAWCWGANDHGQLGANTQDARFNTPQPVRKQNGDPLEGVVSIAAGASHVCAGGDGTGAVYCWGENAHGQVGGGDRVSRSFARPVGLSPALEIAAGEDHSCARLVNGERYCWGGNYYGQLGLGARSFATPTTGLAAAERFVGVAAGFDHTCVQTDSTARRILCFGNNRQGQLGVSSVDLWEGRAVEPQSIPGQAVARIGAGNEYTCYFTIPRNAFCWGDNGVGQVGANSTVELFTNVTPIVQPVDTVDGLGVGEGHACLIAGSQVRCWGRNGYDQLGVPDAGMVERAPRDVPGLSDVLQVAPGGFHTCALIEGGTVKCWGGNDDAQLGGGSTSPPRSITPVTVPGVTDTIAIGSGAQHSCALNRDGTVRCWGARSEGQLGGGTTGGNGSPVMALAVRSVGAIAVGWNHTCALAADGGAAKCWGRGEYGQLGNGAQGPAYFEATPQTVVGLAGASALSAGASHTCAVVDGGLRCWGSNFAGQFGDATPVVHTTPVRVAPLP